MKKNKSRKSGQDNMLKNKYKGRVILKCGRASIICTRQSFKVQN